MSDLTDKQKRFVDEYLIDCNATQAAIRAGYSEKTAESTGSRLLRNAKVSKAIQKRMKSKERRRIAKQDEILEFYTSIMRGEPQEYSSVKRKKSGDAVEETATVGQATPKIEERISAANELAKRYMAGKSIDLEQFRKLKAEADIAEAKARMMNENGDKVAEQVDKLFDKLLSEVDEDES